MKVPVSIKNFLAAHPIVDWIVPIAVIGIWECLLDAPVLLEPSSRDTLFASVSSAAGIALAAATFACTFMYRSPSQKVKDALGAFGKDIGKNWFGVLVSLLAATCAPIGSIIIDQANPHLSMMVALISISLIVVKFARVSFWVRFTLTVEYLGKKAYELRKPPYSGFPRSSGM